MSAFSFYKRVVALNTNVHRNLKLTFDKTDFSFARDTLVILLAGIEFAEAAREFPIVFVRNEENKQMVPVVLLGLRDGENLFVDGQGKWGARCIPAFVRRYPFVMSTDDASGKLAVCIDEGCPTLNADDGELLIDADGKLTPRMNEVMQFLQNVQNEMERTKQIAAQLDELGLFVHLGARLDAPTGETFQINNFYVIDEARFGRIADDKLPGLFRSGALSLVYLHLASLRNLRVLLERVSVRSGMQAAPSVQAG